MRLEGYKIIKKFEIRPYRFKELCDLYEVNPKTFRRWLLERTEAKILLKGRHYPISHVENIVKHLGFPYLIPELNFKVRPYKFKELAALYNISPKTFRKWVKPFGVQIGPLIGGYYIIPQVEAIIENIGLPYFIYDSQEQLMA
jgi:transposase-like protein